MASDDKLYAWRRRDGIYGCKRFMTQKCYDAQSPLMKSYYEPFYCAQFDAMRQRAEKAERAAMRGAQLLAEVTSSDGSGHADLAARILSDAGVSRDEVAKLIEGWKSKSQWRIDAALDQQAAT